MRENSPEHNTSKGKNLWSKRHLTYSNDREEVKNHISSASVLLMHTGKGASALCTLLMKAYFQSQAQTLEVNTYAER